MPIPLLADGVSLVESLSKRTKIERVVQPHDDVGGSRVDIVLRRVRVVGANRHGPLDLRGVPSDLQTPGFEDLAQLGHVVGWTEAVPGVGVLCDETERDLAAGATDHQR